MKIIFLITFVIMSFQTLAGSMRFPKSPDPKLTTGSLCDTPDTYKYPEKIPFCERAVNSFAKEAIFISYRNNLGYSLSGERRDYKVDHFIPLCAGGSNHDNNLWPQHSSISKITDPLEATGCEKLSLGLIKQKELIDLIMKAKLNLGEAPGIFKHLKRLK